MWLTYVIVCEIALLRMRKHKKHLEHFFVTEKPTYEVLPDVAVVTSPGPATPLTPEPAAD